MRPSCVTTYLQQTNRFELQILLYPTDGKCCPPQNIDIQAFKILYTFYDVQCWFLKYIHTQRHIHIFENDYRKYLRVHFLISPFYLLLFGKVLKSHMDQIIHSAKASPPPSILPHSLANHTSFSDKVQMPLYKQAWHQLRELNQIK